MSVVTEMLKVIENKEYIDEPEIQKALKRAMRQLDDDLEEGGYNPSSDMDIKIADLLKRVDAFEEIKTLEDSLKDEDEDSLDDDNDEDELEDDNDDDDDDEDEFDDELVDDQDDDDDES